VCVLEFVCARSVCASCVHVCVVVVVWVSFWWDGNGGVAGVFCGCVMVLCLAVVSFGFLWVLGMYLFFDFARFMFCGV